MTTASVTSYAHPEVLAGREWLEKNLNNPNIRILEIDYDPNTHTNKATYQMHTLSCGRRISMIE